MASYQLPAGVHSFLTSEEGSVEYADSLNVISGQFEAGQLTVLDLVKALAEVLTSTDDATRTRGALLLAEVVGSVPGSVDSAQDMHHLAVFFASRISDWPSLRPALKGCLSLLQRRDELRARCAPADAIEIMRALLDVNVRSLTVADRQLCLQLLLTLIEGYGSDLVVASLSLLEGAAAALDGERDPRCLLAGFSAIQSLATLYAQSGDAPAKELEEHAEEVVDVLGCYFPIVYTPPAQAKGKVTREELVSGVEQALSAAPAFAQYVLPMLLEKLSSSLRQAQEDALSALAACTRGYGAATMEQYLPKIWGALHNVLTAAGEPDLASEDKIKACHTPTNTSTLCHAQELAGKAQVCLRECAHSLTAEGSMQLLDLVLDDGIMRDLLDDVADAGQRGGFAGASRRSQAALPVLAAVARSSPLGSSRVCQRLLVSLIRLTESAQSNETRRLGLQAILCLVSATRTAVIEQHSGQHATDTAELSAAPVRPNVQSDVSASSQLDSSAKSYRDRASLLAGKGAGVLRLSLGSAAGKKQAEQHPEDVGVPSEDAVEEKGQASGKAGADKAVVEYEVADVDVLMLQLQILADLMTFPRTSSPLSEGDQQHALQLLLSYACAASMPPASTSGGNTATSQDLQAQLRHVGGSDQEAVSNVVSCALEGMAQSGYADLLSSTALPHLFAAAGLPAASQAPAQAKAVQSSTSALPGQRTSEAPMHSGSRELGPGSEVSGSNLLADGRAVPALAGIARASSQLREPILAAFKAGIPSALAGAAAEDSQHSPLLTTLSDESLLAEDAIAAESVVLELFDGIAALSKEKKSISGAALHDAATLAQVAACVCSGTKDANIASAACRTVMTAAASLPTRPHAEIAQEVAPAAAALAVLPPGFAAEEQRLQMLRALLNLALGLQDDFAASAAAVAAASVVNKAPKDEVDRAVGMALDDILLPQLGGKGTGCKRALACLGQLSKALVMRGHARFQDSLEAALKLSDELAAAQPMPMEVSPPSGNHTSTYATAADAAQVFGSLVEVDESLLLNRSSKIFSKGRVLWQQRAFSVAADLLIQEFEGAMQNGGAAPSRGTIYCLERLLSVAGRDAPAAMRAGYDRVLPAALTSLVALSGFGDVSDDDVMEALLQQMQQALGTPQGQAVLEGELDRLIPLCAERTLGAAHSEHRAHAVAALESLAAYPYRLLHPFRGQVLAALAKAVDDRKRAVRAAAVRCRRKWGAQSL